MDNKERKRRNNYLMIAVVVLLIIVLVLLSLFLIGGRSMVNNFLNDVFAWVVFSMLVFYIWLASERGPGGSQYGKRKLWGNR